MDSGVIVISILSIIMSILPHITHPLPIKVQYMHIITI